LVEDKIMNENERRVAEAMDKYAAAAVRWSQRRALCLATVDDARAVIEARSAAMHSVARGMAQAEHTAFLDGIDSVMHPFGKT
jgi:hypothetical protein